jgi:hypothetical protein
LVLRRPGRIDLETIIFTMVNASEVSGWERTAGQGTTCRGWGDFSSRIPYERNIVAMHRPKSWIVAGGLAGSSGGGIMRGPARTFHCSTTRNHPSTSLDPASRVPTLAALISPAASP